MKKVRINPITKTCKVGVKLIYNAIKLGIKWLLVVLQCLIKMFIALCKGFKETVKCIFGKDKKDISETENEQNE